uniref:hypothetical protein n=1 Tax=Acinetobacter baumannii TaxID=470 RepID=UPI001C0983C6
PMNLPARLNRASERRSSIMTKIILAVLLAAASIAPAFAQSRYRQQPPSWYSSSGGMVDRQATPSSM